MILDQPHKKTLWLLPAPLSEDLEIWKSYEPASFTKRLLSLEGLFVETPKVARSIIGPALKEAGRQISDFPMYELSEHTTLEQMQEYITKIEKGKGDWGVMSDAGLVLIADPGSKLIELAKKKEIRIQTLGGTSSIITALQLSGKVGQRWMFHGYFPTEEAPFKELLLFCAKHSSYTHLFIETPYRNQKQLLRLCAMQEQAVQRAFLGVYSGLFSPRETHLEKKISEWKIWKGQLDKEPAVFVLSFV